MTRSIEELNAWIEARRPDGRPRTWRGVLASCVLGVFLGLMMGLCVVQSGALDY